MQRTDLAERYLEEFASIPLTWENVFRSPEFTDSTDKEVVDLLFVLRKKGIFVSMKCQMDPDAKSTDKLARWVQKNAKAALRQVRGGIRTSRTREFWCSHPRRGQVNFEPNQIEPIRALVIVETMREVCLGKDMPLEIDFVPVSYLSLNDFLNILVELRTINDLILYLDSRSTFSPALQRTIGIERNLFKFFILYDGAPRKVDTFMEICKEISERNTEVASRIKYRMDANLQAKIIEQLLDHLSSRLERYDEELDEEIVRMFDVAPNRNSYLLMQDELCDLVLDERRKFGACLSQIIEKVRNDYDSEAMGFKALHLDSKPDFLYILSSSKGKSRNEVIKLGFELIHGGLSWYEKSRGLFVNYTQDRDGYETWLVSSFENTPDFIQKGKEFFSKLNMSHLPIEKV